MVPLTPMSLTPRRGSRVSTTKVSPQIGFPLSALSSCLSRPFLLVASQSSCCGRLLGSFSSNPIGSLPLPTDYLNPANIARTNVLVIGEDPCASGALAATKESVNDRWILWCPNKFSQIIRPIPVANTPAQHTDYSTFGYRLTAKRTLNYWRTSLADTMLHEMHHVYVETSTDVIVKIQYPSQRQIAAYGYAGTTQLAENVRVSGNWAQLKMNADSMAIWAIAAYLDGSDWSLGNANGLKDLKDVVVSPPPGGLPRRTAMPGDDGLYQSSQLEAVTRRAEKRFAEKRARAADRYAIGTALGMPGSLVGGREI